MKITRRTAKPKAKGRITGFIRTKIQVIRSAMASNNNGHTISIVRIIITSTKFLILLMLYFRTLWLLQFIDVELKGEICIDELIRHTL